jgi:hypothetical protein
MDSTRAASGALDEALQFFTLGASAAAANSTSSSATSTTTPSSGAAPDTEQAGKRKLVKEMVECSKKVYGIIYAALPEELRKQAEFIPRGFAYGLWL